MLLIAGGADPRRASLGKPLRVLCFLHIPPHADSDSSVKAITIPGGWRYEEMAARHGVPVIPARPRKRRDKANVEAGVLVVERWIPMALRKRTFFYLGEVTQAVGGPLTRLNERPFRKQEERLEDGTIQHRLPRRVRSHLYGVPYELTQRDFEIRASASTVEIFPRGERVASHRRSSVARHFTTERDHRPKAH